MSKITENILADIAKVFLSAKIKKQLKKAERELQDDPELRATLDSLNFNLDQFESKMKNLCERIPNSGLCKGKKTFKAKW